MYHSSILLYISYLPLRSAKEWYFDTFLTKNFYVQEINVEKMQKPSAIVTTISDKQYQSD